MELTDPFDVLAKEMIEKARDRALLEKPEEPITANALDITKNSGYAALAGSVLAAIVGGIEALGANSNSVVVAAALGVIAVAFIANAIIVAADSRARSRVTIASEYVLPALAGIAGSTAVVRRAGEAEEQKATTSQISTLAGDAKIKLTDNEHSYDVFAIRVDVDADSRKTWYLAARKGLTKPEWIGEEKVAQLVER
jgi:hypothetical protein